MIIISLRKILVEKYDDKRALIHTHIHSFASSPINKSESVTGLKKLRDTMSRIVKSWMSR